MSKPLDQEAVEAVARAMPVGYRHHECHQAAKDGINAYHRYLASKGEATCHRCGGPNVPWSAESPLWNEVMRGGDINAVEQEFEEIICPTCFVVLANERGVADYFHVTAPRPLVPLSVVTPSGRTWNAEAFMWEDSP